jgi:Glycosyl hydrolase family 115
MVKSRKTIFDWVICLIFFVVADIQFAFGLGQSPTIGFDESRAGYKLADTASSVRILVDRSDWPGVVRAARDLTIDFGRVTGRNGTLELVSNNTTTAWPNTTAGVIIAGTLGKSKLIDQLAQSHNLSISNISGQWETFVSQVVSNPIPGIPQALLLVGSDKRGTIYSLYDISEQIGVSPWYFWADIPPKQHDSIYAITSLPPSVRGPPSVKYRGIFLNDEAPALTGWVNANFPRGKYGPGYNADFYALVFELLLRLRANLLYPAMWDGMFAVDDVRNQPLADEYGIVMGTSHTEPFARSTKEWNTFGNGSWNFRTNDDNVALFLQEGARRAKPYETLLTIGMRGSHDTPMSNNIEISLLENVVKTQRQILAQENMTNVPQSWCLYKEVQGYYDAGMKVPDDVTLLWADDNWGNIRRLPSESEMSRKGGAGVYYVRSFAATTGSDLMVLQHFDYVGDPRNYKWINTIILQKTWHQMNLAYARGANTIWVVNVGDIKPLVSDSAHFH